MNDYEPDYVYLIPIGYKKQEVFYESIEKAPARIRGALLIEETSREEIEFSIFSPSGVLIYHNRTSNAIFDLSVQEVGTFTIIFDNKYSNTEIKLTFTMNTGRSAVLKKEDLSIVDEKINSLSDFMKRYATTFKMRHNVHSMRFQSNEKKMILISLGQQKANKYFYTFSIVETFAMLGLSIWQFYYMRELVKTKL